MQKSRCIVIKFKSYIAPLLLCLFVFPILFQSLHVLLHHSGDKNVHHHCCSHETCQVLIKHKQNDGISLTKGEDKCAICDYHFVTKNLVDITVVVGAIPLIKCNYETITKQQKYHSALSNKSSRAPPVHIL